MTVMDLATIGTTATVATPLIISGVKKESKSLIVAGIATAVTALSVNIALKISYKKEMETYRVSSK